MKICCQTFVHFIHLSFFARSRVVVMSDAVSCCHRRGMPTILANLPRDQRDDRVCFDGGELKMFVPLSFRLRDVCDTTADT